MNNTKKNNGKKNNNQAINKINKTKKSINKSEKYGFESNELTNTNINEYIEKLIKFIKKNGDKSYPLKKYGYGKYAANLRNIKSRFNNLKKYKYKLSNIKYKLRANYDLPDDFFNYRDIKTNIIKPTILLFDNNNYLNYDLISDYFQELERVKCKRYNSEFSPYDYWNGIINDKYVPDIHYDNIKKILNKCIKQFNGKINAETLNESMYSLTNECSQFRPTVLVSLIKLFGGRKRILDISSGWGDRLIGAIASNVDYYFGVDPNPAVHKGYNDIIKIFNANPSKFIIKKSGFETVKIQMPPNGKMFDLIMTSPPYFDLEIYTNAEGQSVIGRGKTAWLNEFMLPSLKKAWDVLETGGILALNISNKSDAKLGEGYVEDIVKYMNSIVDSDFRGCISYADYRFGTQELRNPQPIWIWLKI